MDVTTETIGTAQVVHIAGKLDHTSSPALDARLRELLEAGHTRLILDLGQLTYVSSAGLRSFILIYKEMKAVNGVVVLASVRRHVQEVLDIVGFTPLFTIVPTAEEAVAKIQSSI